MRLLALAIALTACGESAPENPHLDPSALGFTLTLPAPMQQSLDAAEPGLRMIPPFKFRAEVREASAEASGVSQALFAVVGDFDGDGAQDVVIEGTSPVDSALVVVAIMNGSKPKAIEIARYSAFDADAIGIYLSRPVRPKPGAFEVVNYPDASTLYFYSNGKFEGMQTPGT